jgi:hypothetical protein
VFSFTVTGIVAGKVRQGVQPVEKSKVRLIDAGTRDARKLLGTAGWDRLALDRKIVEATSRK